MADDIQVDEKEFSVLEGDQNKKVACDRYIK